MVRVTARPECSCIADDQTNEFDTCFIENFKYTGRAHVSVLCVTKRSTKSIRMKE